MDKREALRKFRLFADVLRPDQLDQLAAQCHPCFFRPKAILMTQGDFGSSMFGIVEGSVSVTFLDAMERENEVAVLTAGQVVGEMALLTGDRRTATVTALTSVDALEISKPALEKMFAKAPYLVESFAATLAIRKAMLDEIAAEHGVSITDYLVKQIRHIFSGVFGAEEKPVER